ncbi:HAMP domain-containing sensor histidine kinase [Bacteroides sp. 214]|uniref:sensor histidine kinase n=1 Tax=Bacteroides sp. 214 TaxID=2302935 RepID=UPI0013D0E491|nr:HAMP domain-containing sensor histidine kinase [Bacteroides sp. 214]
MAEQEGDKRMQAVALSTKLEYYYYGNNIPNKKDSIIAWVDRVKQFAKKTNQPKYYYFAWSSRLIYYYLHINNLHLALNEAEKMLRDAQAENNLDGIMTCYNSMAAIYEKKGLLSRALEYTLLEIELFENNEIEKYNISGRYCSAVDILTELKQFDKIPLFLDKAKKYSKTDLHHLQYLTHYIDYDIAINKPEDAYRKIEEASELFKNNKALAPHLHILHHTQFTYYRYIKDFEKALSYLDLWRSEVNQRRDNSANSAYSLRKADLFWDNHKKAESADLYKEYIEFLDQEKIEAEQITTAEFSTLLNIQKLNAEKQELENIARQKKLQHTRITLGLLSIILLVVIYFSYNQIKTNKILKLSKSKLDKKNSILEKAQKELRIAKEVAEENSRLKTVFIQNMSHEIRTPLNSIVGFSAVLSGMFEDKDEEVKTYASLIEENSQVLLRLIDNILTISALDGSKQMFPVALMDVNQCCKDCISKFEKEMPQEVALIFESGREVLRVESNLEHITLALNHLLSNAIKFTKEGKVMLTYDYNDKKGLLTFTVTDTGIGIPVEEQQKVFERFFKLDEFTQGTGLGLSISHIIAERFGGKVVIDMEYTGGCRVHFTVPAKVCS